MNDVTYVHTSDWEPDEKLSQRGMELCGLIFDGLERLIRDISKRSPDVFIFTGDLSNYQLFKPGPGSRAEVRKRFELLFEKLSNLRWSKGTRCYWTIASHESEAFQKGQWPFDLLSVSSTFRFFCNPGGEIDVLPNSSAWVLGFGHLGGQKDKGNGKTRHETYKRSTKEWLSRAGSGFFDPKRMIVASAAGEAYDLAKMGAAYVALGGLQAESSRRGVNTRSRVGLMGRPYSIDGDGRVRKHDYVVGTFSAGPMAVPSP
jgi:hypothetical protein